MTCQAPFRESCSPHRSITVITIALHQPASILRPGGPTIDKSFLAPLLIMILGYTFLFLWLWQVRMQTEILERRARSLMMARGA